MRSGFSCAYATGSKLRHAVQIRERCIYCGHKNSSFRDFLLCKYITFCFVFKVFFENFVIIFKIEKQSKKLNGFSSSLEENPSCLQSEIRFRASFFCCVWRMADMGASRP
ncbi:MAG: hypothetical protein J6O04_03045 [Selenomonadaceae bacterium]|nr:hypothetical protein [Selenomonadaceae bacterium]